MEVDDNIDLSSRANVENHVSRERSSNPEDDIQEYKYNYLTTQNGIEDISRYNKGGFHPIHLGHYLDNRFEVYHKLGSGGFGTVWLCWDRQLSKWRAVKVMTADHSSDSAEAKTFDFLTQNCTLDELDQNHIAVPLETFWIDGPNGRHLCLVMQVYGHPVSEWRSDLSSLDPSTKKHTAKICGQITQALAFLHEKGVCHGDFRPSNILMKLDQDALHEIAPCDMDRFLGAAEAYDVQTRSGGTPLPRGPEYCVTAVSSTWCQKLLIQEAAVVDFGGSFFTHSPKAGSCIPRSYASPEVLFRQTSGVGADIWALACTIFEVRTDERLFGTDFWEGSKPSRILYEIEVILGPLAEPYREPRDRENLEGPSAMPGLREENEESHLASLDHERSSHIDGTGYDNILEAMLGRERKKYHSPFGEHSFEPPIRYRYEKDEVQKLADLLGCLFKYNPEDRLRAKDALQHPWFQTTASSRALCTRTSTQKASWISIFLDTIRGLHW
ncbi:kinase-like domain-containing protein [Xylaria bambusicola]|uniref:kinase-like domain-containing protein n=1 Tax=Xylaria bambusicola TaxID=326684 RepID=UPI0020082F32|nr:kinase-like domain-containing protein [Xylaria bambusicola]KAI0506501.1 kinase-like domain-containing protein [Xylaria bambusicola]